MKMARSITERLQALKERGASIYLRNMLLIDLSLNPHLLANDMYVCQVLANEPVFDSSRINEEARRHRIRGLITEYSKVIAPFKSLPGEKITEEK